MAKKRVSRLPKLKVIPVSPVSNSFCNANLRSGHKVQRIVDTDHFFSISRDAGENRYESSRRGWELRLRIKMSFLRITGCLCDLIQVSGSPGQPAGGSEWHCAIAVCEAAIRQRPDQANTGAAC